MHRYTSAQGVNFIEQWEGFSNTPYLCSGNFLTIGYGHKLNKAKTLTKINEVDAEKLLAKDLYKAEIAVLRYINVPLLKYQFDALVSFTFNLGNAALQRSTLRQKINYEAHTEAADEFLKWIYVSGVAIRGLVRRRQHERELYLRYV